VLLCGAVGTVEEGRGDSIAAAPRRTCTAAQTYVKNGGKLQMAGRTYPLLVAEERSGSAMVYGVLFMTVVGC
jgi:hypothetical protein